MSRTIEVCPECGSATVTCNAVGGGRAPTERRGRYHCKECGHYCDELDEREVQNEPGGRRGLAGDLLDTDPAEVP